MANLGSREGEHWSSLPSLHEHNGNGPAYFRTVVKHVSDQFKPEDVESIAYIKSLALPDPKTGLAVLMALEKGSFFSPTNIEPLISLLKDINRADIVHSCSLEQYQSELVARNPLVHQGSNSSVKSRESEIRRQDALDSLRSPSSASNTDSSLLSLEDASKEEKLKVLQRLMSDPQIQSSHEAKAMFERIRSEPLMSLAEDASSLSLMSDELETTESIDFRTLTSSDSPKTCRDSRTIATQTSCSPESKKSSSDTLSSPLESGAVGLLAPPNSKSSPAGQGTLFCASCQKLLECAESVPSPYPRPPSPEPPFRRKASMEGLIDDYAVLSSPTAAGVASPTNSVSSDVIIDQSVRKSTLHWQIRRTCVCTHICKHSEKAFTKEMKLKIDGDRRNTVKLTLKLIPAGEGKDVDSSCTLIVSVSFSKKLEYLKDTSMLHMRIKAMFDAPEDFETTKIIKKPLESFVMNDFLPHEVIKHSHSTHLNIHAEGCLCYDAQLV